MHLALEVQDAACSTEESRERYLSTVTLYEEILALVTDPTLLVGETTSNRAVREREIVRLAGDLLAAVEVAESLRIPGSSYSDTAGSFLGISEEDFEASVMERYSNNQQMLVQALLPKVEARLRDKCDKIDAFAMGQEDDNFAVGGCSQLPTIIAERRGRVQTLQKGIDCLSQEMQLLQFQFSQSLAALTSKMQRYVTDVTLGSNYPQNRVDAEDLMAEIETFQTKLRACEVDILAETYTGQTLPALRKIRDRLDVRHHEATVQLQALMAQLSQFDGLGAPFAALAIQYGEIQHQIELVKGDLQVCHGSSKEVLPRVVEGVSIHVR